MVESEHDHTVWIQTPTSVLPYGDELALIDGCDPLNDAYTFAWVAVDQFVHKIDHPYQVVGGISVSQCVVKLDPVCCDLSRDMLW